MFCKVRYYSKPVAAGETGIKELEQGEFGKKKNEIQDYRAIAKAQRLFITNDSSPGVPFFLPHGTRIYNRLQSYLRAHYLKYGYEEIITPQMFKSSLWKKSGHWDKFAGEIFKVSGVNDNVGKRQDVEVEEYGLKPMNCPGHCLVFESADHSFRELPIRYAEFSFLHRNEVSGSLTGLSRVRRFCQDDAHIFCTTEQIEEEILSNLKFTEKVYKDLGLDSYRYVLSTRPENYIGELQVWDEAESQLKRALEKSGREWTLNEGDGAFYGPKIDVIVEDITGKAQQAATTQLDFQLPERFNLKYRTSNNTQKTPVMVHRAILGSFERALSLLIENTQGKWPFWLSPRQAIVLPISSTTELVDYAYDIKSQLQKAGLDQGMEFWIDVDGSDKTISKRIREARAQRYNYILVVGEKEMANKTVNARTGDGSEEVSIEDLAQKFSELSKPAAQ